MSGFLVDNEGGVFNSPNTRTNLGNYIATLVDGDFAVQRTTNNGQMLVELSISPFVEDKESYLEYNDTVRPPFTLDVPFSISQRARNAYFQLETIQKVGAGVASVAGPAIAITSIAQTGTTVTIILATATSIQRGEWFDTFGVDDSRLNLSNANVLSVSTDGKTITCTFTDDLALTSSTIAAILNLGFFRRQALAIREPNGSALRFTGSSSVNAPMSRSALGNVRIGATTQGVAQILSSAGTAPVISNGGNGQSEIKATSAYEIQIDKNSVTFLDYGVDSTASQSTVRALQESSVPEYYAGYTPRLRAVSPKSMSRPVAKIISAVKTGTTTATITTDVPHGLITSKSYVEILGIRDQVNFVSSTGLLVTVIDSTSFTVVIGTAVTATSYGGSIILRNGVTPMTGFTTQAVQSISIDADGILTVIGNATWTTIVVGEYVNLYGCRRDLTGDDVGLDGVYVLIDLSTTTIKLRAVTNPDGTRTKNGSGVDVTPALPVTASTNCGGTLIMRTTGRIHDLRLEERSYDAVKIMGQGESRTDLALPVTVQNTVTVTHNAGMSTGTTAYKLISAATTNSTLVLTGVRYLLEVSISNDTAAKVFLKLYNKATAPTIGTDIPVYVIMIPANTTLFYVNPYMFGTNFSLGLGFGITGLSADADITAVAAGVVISMNYK